MAVIEDYISSTGCHVIVHDDCIVKTQEEVDRIIGNVSKIMLNEHLRKQAQKGS